MRPMSWRWTPSGLTRTRVRSLADMTTLGAGSGGRAGLYRMRPAGRPATSAHYAGGVSAGLPGSVLVGAAGSGPAATIAGSAGSTGAGAVAPDFAEATTRVEATLDPATDGGAGGSVGSSAVGGS